MLHYSDTPVSEIHHPILEQFGIRVLIKREDLNHPLVSGNKWWKLKYNLTEAVRLKHDTLLTYGGAFSNHIYATAAASREIGLKSIGLIRGEETLPLNPTLRFAEQCGMRLHYLSRRTYKDVNSPAHRTWLVQAFGNCYCIPEGGTNELAIKGCEELGRKLDETASDVICLPVGTGGTMAGVIRGVSPEKKVLGFAVLNNAGFLSKDVQNLAGAAHPNWEVLIQYAYGGYAKRHPHVLAFIRSFYEATDIPLDFVYTGKMMCAIFDLVEKKYFSSGTTLLALHTGGLQGHS